MDGVAALRSVLAADSDLTALVAAAKVIAGPAPTGTALPFISLESISKNDRNLPAPGAKRFVWERVQATVVAANYPSQKAILRAVRHAAADQIDPPVTGIDDVTIHTDSAGPDFYDPDYAGWRGSQDFMTKYSETR